MQMQIHEYSQFFIKRSFDLPEYHKKIVKKKIIRKDYLFYSLFCKINKIDITSTSFETYNEKQEKTILAEKIDKLNLKFKNKDFIMNNLMYDSVIHLMTFDILCMYYKINVIFIKNMIYYPMIYDTPENIDNVLYLNDQYEFIIYDSIKCKEIFEIMHLDKPLYSISHYKVDDLLEICKKLQLPCERIKKQLLYDSIYSTLVNLNIYKID